MAISFYTEGKTLKYDPVTRTMRVQSTMVEADTDEGVQDFFVTAKRSEGLRQPSNLISYAQRKLSTDEIREGFFGFYFGRQLADLRLSARLFYLGLVMSFIKPNVRLDQLSRRWSAKHRILMRQYMTEVKKLDVSLMTQVQKNLENQTFVVRAPVLVLSPELFNQFQKVMYLPDPGSIVQEEAPLQENQVFLSSKLTPANGFLTPKLIAGLEACDAKLLVRVRGTKIAFFLELSMTKEQASYLTTLPWTEIRPADVYGPLRDWVGGFNIKRRAPAFTVPLNKIRSSLPATKDIRVNEDSILVDESAEYWCVPGKVDGIDSYDSAFSTYLTNPSHFFSACSDELIPKTNRPAAQPVFVDWVNLKFAYSAVDSGTLIIKDLSRCVPATMTHYYRLLNAPILKKYTWAMLMRGDTLGRKYGTYSGKPAQEVLEAYCQWLARNGDETGIKSMIDVTLRTLYENSSLASVNGKPGTWSSRDVDDYLRSLPKTLKALEDNLAAANRDFSVETICQLQAFLRIVTRWGPKYEEVSLADSKRREKYSNQFEDPNYKLEELPYLAPDRFMLPHQSKVNNFMRTSPDFAVLAVDAGGGKTPLSVYDFLKELKNNPDVRGLILCPSTLVSQHVKEFVDFTNGMVNTIPVTSYTVRRQGLQRLQEMITKAPVNSVVIADYNVLFQLAPTKVGYGTTTQTVYPAVEFLRQFRFDWVFCDECFVAGTLVDTPNGPRAIETIREGDYVLGADGPARVRGTTISFRVPESLVEVTYNGTTQVVTENHPFFTRKGIVLAGSLTTEDELLTSEYSSTLIQHVQQLSTGAKVPMVQGKVPCAFYRSEEAFLQHILFSEMEDATTRSESKGSQPRSNRKDTGIKKLVGGLRGWAKDLCQNLATYEAGQSYAFAGSAASHASNSEGYWTPAHDTRRKWDRPFSLRETAARPSTESGVSARGTHEGSTIQWSGYTLQDRPGFSKGEASRRGGWSVSFDASGEATRPQENKVSDFFRVDRVARYQPRSEGERTGSIPVYNLHVERHPSYSVNGALVHNCHFLKNRSNRTLAVHRLISEIPKKRLASGTFVANVVTDVVQQVALFDPTIFGNLDEFTARYSTGKVKGKTVWNEARISEDLRKEVVWAEARRKEWAALLPPVEPTFRIVPIEGTSTEPDENGFVSKAFFTDKQREVYGQIMTAAKEAIIAKSKENTAEGKKLRKLLKGLLDEDVIETNPEPDEDDEADEDHPGSEQEEGDEGEDDTVVDLESLLHPYLQRLEQFMTAPMSDPLGQAMLTDPKDQVSPKVTRIVEILDEHFAGIENGTIQGKVLIFTSYIDSGAAIYEGLPPKYKEKCIHFLTSRQAECKAAFENDPDKMIMVGVEHSMNTGLNFQFVSRLIRIESVWTPGQFEQGNSRLVRPSLKTAEFRNVVYLDWIVCDKSIDITKSCFLIQKIISKSKFDEYKGWPGYQIIRTPPPFKMNLDTIFEFNSADVLTNDYLTPYANYLQEQQNEYSDFRTQYEAKMRKKMGSANYDKWVKEKGSPLVWENLTRSANLPESKLMSRVPYVPGIQLYGTSQLGLVRYDEFLRINPAELEFEDDDGKETPEQKLKNEAEMRKLYGMYAHTDYGDGEIVRVSNFAVTIRLESGIKVSSHKLATFIITKPETSGKDMRKQLAKLNAGIPLGEELETPGAAFTQLNKERKNIQRQIDEKLGTNDTRIPMVIKFGTLNDYLMMQVANTDDARVVRAAQAQGFKFMPAHYVLHVQRQERLKHIINVWAKSGTPEDKKPLTPKLTMDPSCSKALQNVWNHMVKKGLKGGELYGLARASEIRIFQKILPKAEPRKTHIFPYPFVEDHKLYLGLPSTGHPASLLAIKILKAKAAPGAGMWKLVTDTERMYLIAPGPKEALRKMQSMEDNGIVIVNREEAEAKLKSMKQVIQLKQPEDE